MLLCVEISVVVYTVVCGMIIWYMGVAVCERVKCMHVQVLY